jgi:preprotein translocase subunit YajC
MTFRNKLFLTMIPLALIAAPAVAQTAAAFSAGAKVSDTQGGEVGTITSVDGEFVIVKTDRHEVRLPKASFTAHNGGFIMAMTRAQLNAEVDKAQAQALANLAAGAAVAGSDGGSVGTIDAIDAEFVTVKLSSGKLVRLPRSAVSANASGAVVGMSVAELEAAAGAAAEAPSAPQSGGTAR